MSRRLLEMLAVYLWCLTQHSPAADKPDRVTRNVVALYTFEKTAEGVLRDRSGNAEPLNVSLPKASGLRSRSDRLIVQTPILLKSEQNAGKVVAAIKRSGALTVEAWIKPGDASQTGPARIVSLSADPGHRNFTIGQDGTRFDVRLRTTATNENGIPSLVTPENSVHSELTHFVFTRNNVGSAEVFLNGKITLSAQIGGDLSGWSNEYPLLFANELTGDRPWRGEFHLAALYDRALTHEEVAQNFHAGIPAAIDYAANLPPPAGRPVDFVQNIQPIFRQRCYECHAQGNEEGGLNLGIKRSAISGGNNGPVITPGRSVDSRLIHVVAGVVPTEVMPPSGQRLSDEQIGLLRAWIDQGATWPDGVDVLDPKMEQARQHWAFQPLKNISPPPVMNAKWVRTSIDQFILSTLEQKRLGPSAPVSAGSLLRRLCFDVTGLPPTREQAATFRAAMEQDGIKTIASQVQSLLDNPHYGERWGRHWLDIARYADSDGQESDRDRPEAYRFRDFVIRAFNQDMPFDQFVRWQLAGNEYEPDNLEAVAATGFLTAGPFAELPDNLLEDERLRTRYNELDDIVSTIGTGMLGLTLGCARCHDHKYDAIPARDYYGILSALHSGNRAEVTIGSAGTKVFAYRDFGADRKPTWLFRRGDYYDHEQPVQLGFVSIMTRDKSPDEFWKTARPETAPANTTYQRRALADWITDVDQGAGALLARVIVNRVWQHHFGEGLVRTVTDFGVRSEPPSHPDLLDWLANDFIQHGWKLKRLHQMVLTSAVYQQASQRDAPLRERLSEVSAIDPDNHLLWKMRPQRLEAEALRDAMLAVSGTLNRQQYGPAFKPPISSEAKVARNLKDPYPDNINDSPDVRRRSIYLFHKRVVPYPFLLAFDKPDAQQSCGRRDATTVAPQALALLNDPFVRTVSIDFAARILKEVGNEPADCVEHGYQLALGREPRDSERKLAVTFIQNQIEKRAPRSPSASADDIRRQSLADFCQMVFSLNEFLYID